MKTKQIIIGGLVIAALFFTLGVCSTFIKCGPDPVRERSQMVRIDEDTVYTYAGDLDKDDEKALLDRNDSLKEANKLLAKENYRLYGVVETTVAYEGFQYESEGKSDNLSVWGFQPKPFNGFDWEFKNKTLSTSFYPFEAKIYHTHYVNGNDLVVVAHLESDEELLNIKNQDYKIDLKELYGKKWYQHIYLTGGAGVQDKNPSVRTGAGFDLGPGNLGASLDIGDSTNIVLEYNWYPW